MTDSNLTLEKIAKLAGVSRSTVSRVVNNQASVRPEVRARVQQVIAETGYHPHPAARSLAGQRAGIIGLAIPREVQSLFTDPYYPRLMQGIAQACNTHDFILSLFLFHTEQDEERLAPRILRNRLVDGVIVCAPPAGDPFVQQLLASDTPFVMVGRPAEAAPPISFVNVDNVNAAAAATTHLLRQGRQRIAAITGPLNTTVGQDRRQGYENALRAAGISPDPNLITEGDFTEQGGYAAMQRLLPQQPDAVFVASDTMALGALGALRLAGRAVPGDVAVVGFDDLPAAALADPPLTTVYQPIRRLGARAVDHLIGLFGHPEQPASHTIAETRLVVRQTCGASL
ncbi:MAG: LacI family DNA-binding transcriptional regulator [Anaerolineae bacterium]